MWIQMLIIRMMKVKGSQKVTWEIMSVKGWQRQMALKMRTPIQNHKQKQVTHHKNNNDLIKQFYAVKEASLSCGGGGLLVKLFGDSPTTLKQT